MQNNQTNYGAFTRKAKFGLYTTILLIASMAIFVGYQSIKARNTALAKEISQLEDSREQLAIREAQSLALLSDVEDAKAEVARLSTPIDVRLMLPKMAVVTFYTCDASMTPSQKAINCPNGVTATKTKPAAYYTAACDRSNLGKKFNIVGFGTLSCEDTGGAIKGGNRFDVYLDSYKDAMELGTKQLPYSEVI